jgi:hypothetical protein
MLLTNNLILQHTINGNADLLNDFATKVEAFRLQHHTLLKALRVNTCKHKVAQPRDQYSRIIVIKAEHLFRLIYVFLCKCYTTY